MTDSARGLLPAFALDCREWITVAPEDIGISEQDREAPCLAVLSTAVVGEGFHSARALIMVGLLDGSPLDVARVEGTGLALELPAEHDAEDHEVIRRFVVPAPVGELALLIEIEFSSDDTTLTERAYDLVSSFQWKQAA